MSGPGDGMFERLTACREDVFRVCLGFSRNVAEAEDLCQDVFMKALARAGDLRQPDGLRIWLLRIARTTCLDHLRRKKRFATVSFETVPETAAAPEADPGGDRDLVLCRVKEAVDGLPRKQREVFVLREYGGLSYEDLARTLGTREGTIMSRLNRARRAVAAAVKEAGREEA